MNAFHIGSSCLLLAALGLAAPAPPSAPRRNVVGWPTLGGDASRNFANTSARGLPGEWSVKRGAWKNVLWAAPLGNHSYSSPAVAGGRIFVGTNNEKPRDPKVMGDKGVMMCFDEKTGKLLWQITHDKLEDNNQDFPKQGIASTACVDGERLYYVSNRCELVCADVAGDGKGRGKILWSLDMRDKLKVFPCQLAISSPLVVGGLVFVITGHGVDIGTEKVPRPDAPSFLAADKKTGAVVWTSSLPGKAIMRGQWSSPSAALVNDKWQVVFAGGDGWLYGLSAEKGELLWKFNLNLKKETPYKAGGSGERSFVFAAPVIVDGRCTIATGQEPDDGQGVGHLWCVDITKKPTNKEKDLSIVNDDLDPRSAANKGSGLVWHFGGKLPKPNADERDWDFGRTLGTVSVHDGLVYASELAGYLHCLDAKTGKPQWTFDLEEGTWCSPFYAGGKVYIGTDSGEVLVFKSGRERKLLRKVKVGNPVKSPPVAVGRTLYLNTETMLYAIRGE